MPIAGLEVIDRVNRFLCLIFKWLAGLVVALILTAVLGLLSYDLAYFQSRKAEIDAMIAAADEAERKPPGNVLRLIRAAYPDRLNWLAARELITDLHVSPRKKGMLHWHVTGFLWTGLVALHLSEQEKITLFISRAYMGQDLFGFSSASRAMFGIPLTALSENQAATLVAITFSP